MESIKPSKLVKVKYTQIFINNEWHNSVTGKVFPVINPATAEKICDVQEGDQADVEKAVQAAKDAFKLGSPWRTMDASERGRLLYKLADLIERDAEYIISLETLETGKHFRETFIGFNFCTKYLRYYAGCADKIHGKTIPADGSYFCYTRLEPSGVCGLIIPWNFPAILACDKLAPALAAGNTTILKPSELAPLTCIYIASLAEEAGFPPGVVNVVPGYGPTAGGALASSHNVDRISFTGGSETGKLIRQAAALSNGKRVTLELGGKSPLVICSDVDVDEAVQIAHHGLYLVMGQLCCAATRTLVHEDIYDEFVAKSKALAKARVVGDPFSETTELGALIDEQHMNHVLDVIETAKRQGAKLECGGCRIGTKGYFIEPTIFTNVTDDMSVAREEILGPVMAVMKFKTLDEAIERANDTSYGLAAGILTKDIDKAIMFSNGVRAGLVWVNVYLELFVQTPFGGYKMSGVGREGGTDALQEYCEVKNVTIKIPQKNS